MRPFASLLVPSLLLLVLAGCESNDRKRAEPASEAAPLAGHATLDSFLAHRYGVVPDTAGMPAADGWSLRICADSAVVIEGVPHRLVAICRSNPSGSHAEGGLTDAYLLRLAAGRVVPVAQDTGRESGSNGTPGEISFARSGRAEWGSQTVSGFLGQGNYEQALEWRVFSGDTARTVLYLTTLTSNEGTIECAEDSTLCSSRSAHVSLDTSDASLERYPVDLVDSIRSGGTLEVRRHRLTFDTAVSSWLLPATPGGAADGN